MPFITLAIIYIAEFFTVPKNVLFYDQPEYLRIISTHSFWQVFSLGHFPIHPIFMGIFWIGNKFVSANLIAWIFGIISTLLIYKISKLIFGKGKFWLAAIIFVLFPAVWIMNTNLMVESISLTFFLLSIYLFLKKKSLGFVIGLFQCLALVPGMSRSGSTISGGLFAGITREAAARFSFLLSLPIIFGSGLKKVFDLYQGGLLFQVESSLIIASIFAFISGLLAIHFLIKFLKNHSLNYFGVYRIILAIIILIWL